MSIVAASFWKVGSANRFAGWRPVFGTRRSVVL